MPIQRIQGPESHLLKVVLSVLVQIHEPRTELIILHSSWHIIFLGSKKGLAFILLLKFVAIPYSFHFPLPPLTMFLMCLVSISFPGPILPCIHTSSQSQHRVSRVFSHPHTWSHLEVSVDTAGYLPLCLLTCYCLHSLLTSCYCDWLISAAPLG